MKTGAVNHIGINTVDLKVSEKFYSEVMGFAFVGEVDLGGDYVAYMKVDENTMIELFLTEGDLPVHLPADGNTGLKHIAFDVDDVDAWYESLTAKGYVMTLEPTDIPAIGKRALLFRAPDNVIIELCMDMV